MLLSRALPVFKKRSLPFREALLSSGVMAFAGLGDALLYPVLPIYGESMGFSVFFIGLLLSINRFVRIISNTPVANFVNMLGMKRVLIISSISAAFTTVFYGLKLGAIIFLLARIVWGLSYSGLKIATLSYAAETKKSGLAFGMSESIKTGGALFVLFIGPILIDSIGIENSLFLIALISSIGIVLALVLPPHQGRPRKTEVKTKKTFSPNPINLLVFILSIIIDGILVVALASLLSKFYSDTGTLLVGVSFYLLLKKFFVLVFSFVSGFLTLRIPALKMFNIAVTFCIAGTFLIALDFAIIGIILAFLFNTFIVTFSPLIAIQAQGNDENSLQAISGISTWWDFGAATGAFAGIYLVELLGSQYLFLILSGLMTALFVNFILNHANTSRTIVQPSFTLCKKQNQ